MRHGAVLHGDHMLGDSGGGCEWNVFAFCWSYGEEEGLQGGRGGGEGGDEPLVASERV